MNTIEPTILAYVAGLMDGEGSIVIGVSKPSATRSSTSPSHWLQVSITSTNRDTIDWLSTVFDGHISSHCTNTSAKGKKDCWSWRVMSNAGAAFLTLILPYLRSKKAPAELAIAFQESRKGYANHLTPELIAQRDWYKAEISKHAIKPRGAKVI
jgi:hypothetical protein